MKLPEITKEQADHCLAELTALVMEASRRRASDFDIQSNGDLSFSKDGEEYRDTKNMGKDFPSLMAASFFFTDNYGAQAAFSRAKAHFEKHRCATASDFAHTFGEMPVRVHCDSRKGRLGVNFRLISTKIPAIEDIKVPAGFVKTIIEAENGLVLVAGATGSGKSSTLAATLQHYLDTVKGRLVTYESPIEFPLRSNVGVVIQKEIGIDCPSYLEATESAMRENADIVMLGEIRDPETTLAAIRLAATGHLVIGTVHSGTAAGTIDRIIESAPKEAQNFYRSLLADNLQAVLAQRLIRVPTGGRVAIHELLLANVTTTALIKGAKTGQLNDTISRSRDEGMFTFTQCAAKLVMDEIVDEEEAIRVIGTSREEYNLQKDALLNRTKAEAKPIVPVEPVKTTPTAPASWIKPTIGAKK